MRLQVATWLNCRKKVEGAFVSTFKNNDYETYILYIIKKIKN